MKDILEAVKRGDMEIEEADREIKLRLYGQGSHNIDTDREKRTLVPEVVHAEGKEIEHLKEIISSFLERTGRVLVSRIFLEVWNEIRDDLERDHKGFVFQYSPVARFLVARSKDHKMESSGGKVGILTAGTSDISAATEAEITAREMGCSVRTFHDVGVAGVHRVMGPLNDLEEWGADAIIVAAGREGALPTLVSGMIKTPVIGLPVSTGYGIHGHGETALFAMLQSCSPIAVVNIDAGFVAGAIAGKIAISKDHFK